MSAPRPPRNRDATRVVAPRRRAKSEPAAPQQFRSHALFGQIPLVRRTAVWYDGKTVEWLEADLDYAPPLPKGAVRGDVRRQHFRGMCHVPRYFYVDEERVCAQCGRAFTFTGREQKHWYEKLCFPFDSVPVRCLACRRQRRTASALREELARTRAAVQERPDDPAAWLALARALVELHTRTGAGRLDDAVAASRKAQRLWPEAVEGLYWEARAQAGLGREPKARDAFARFLAVPAGRKRYAMAAEARAYLGVA